MSAPTLAQVTAVADAARDVCYAAYHAENLAQFGPSDARVAGYLAYAWRHYHTLGEALRATDVEPPQPPEGV